ncbi:MAG: type I-E CRISPR-associated endoribonuclease Cas2 [Phycisphaerae bacterium]|nr:type I-E CRISPR-associated endoribonuclease Cas2 [Phycisphaerae bacterium]
MVILILERVTPGLRGELTRWMIQPKTGVFVGRFSALVRDKLWDRVQKSVKTGAGIMVYTTNTPQGYAVRTCGRPDRDLVDFEGLILAKTRKRE